MALKASYDRAELTRLFADAEPATPDEATITSDGRRLDSAEAVIAYFNEIRAQRV